MEIIIVVAIIGILASLAMPRLGQFQAKARTAEAVKNLHSIYALEQVYQTTHSSFSPIAEPGMGANLQNLRGTCIDTANELGFDLAPCDPKAISPLPRYSYIVRASATSFVAIARTGAGDFNRVCQGNDAHYFAIDQTQKFVAKLGALPNLPASATAAIPGNVLPISTLCPKR